MGNWIERGGRGLEYKEIEEEIKEVFEREKKKVKTKREIIRVRRHKTGYIWKRKKGGGGKIYPKRLDKEDVKKVKLVYLCVISGFFLERKKKRKKNTSRRKRTRRRGYFLLLFSYLTS